MIDRGEYAIAAARQIRDLQHEVEEWRTLCGSLRLERDGVEVVRRRDNADLIAQRDSWRRVAERLEGEKVEALAERDRYAKALENLTEAADWYRRCLEDVQDRRPVRGLDEAKVGYDRAYRKARGLLDA